MGWTIILYETARGEKPVESFIRSCEKATIAKIIHLVDLLEKYGSSLGMPHTKRLSSVLFELRIRGRQEIRILYCMKKKNIYLLHGFKKQTQKTPKKELDAAMKRFQTLTDV